MDSKKQFAEIRKLLTGQDALKEIKDESCLTLFSRHKFSFSFIFSLLSCLLALSLCLSLLLFSLVFLLCLLSLCLSLLALSLSVSLSPCDVACCVVCDVVCGSAHVVSVVVSVVCVVVAVVVVVVCVCVCGVHAEKHRVSTQHVPCVRSKRPRVCRQHAHMCFNMCACCRHTRGRFERTHVDVLSGHTEKGGNHRQFCLPKFAHIGLSRASEVHKRNPGIFPIFSLRIGREQHVHDSSNHSLFLIKLFSFSYPEGNSGGNQL